MQKRLVCLVRQSHHHRLRTNHTAPTTTPTPISRFPKASVTRPTETCTAKWILHSRESRLLQREPGEGEPSIQTDHWYRYNGPLIEATPEIIAFLQSLGSAAGFQTHLQHKTVPPSLHKILFHAEDMRRLGRALAVRHPQLAIRLLEFCDFRELCFNRAFVAIGFRLMIWKHWEEILLLSDLCRRKSGQVPVPLVDMVIRALTMTQQFSKLPTLIPALRRDGKYISRQTFHLLIVGYIRNHDIAAARACLKEMEESGLASNAKTAAVVAVAYNSIGFNAEVEERALAALPELPMAQRTLVMNALISARLQSSDIAGARRLLSMFKIGSVKDSETGANSFATAVHPNTETFAIAARNLTTQGEYGKAFAYLQAVTESGMKHNSSSLIELVRLYVLSGETAQALHVVARISLKLVGEIVEAPWSSLLSFFPTRRYNQISKDFENAELTSQVFSNLLRGILPLKDGFQGSILIADIMRLHKIKPDLGTIAAFAKFIDRDRESRGIKHSVTLGGSVKFLNSKFNVPLQLDALNRAVAARIRTWKHSEQSQSQRGGLRRLAFPIGPHHTLPGPAVDIPFTKSRDVKHLRGLVRELAVRGVMPDAWSYLNRIKYDAILAGDVDSASQVLQNMQERGIPATQYHYAALIEGYLRNSNIAGANVLLQDAVTSGSSTHPALFTILMKDYGMRGRPHGALRVLQLMETAEVQADAIAAMTMSIALGKPYMGRNGQLLWNAARALLKKLYPARPAMPTYTTAFKTRRLLLEKIRVKRALVEEEMRPFAAGMDIDRLQSWKKELADFAEMFAVERIPELNASDLFWGDVFATSSRRSDTSQDLGCSPPLTTGSSSSTHELAALVPTQSSDK